MLKLLWKRYWKTTFVHCFYHNFWSTKNFWVRFISLETRQLGLQFKHIFYLIWTYIEWVVAVWSWAIKTVKIKISGDACMHVHPQTCIWRLIFRSPEIHFLGPKASSLMGPALDVRSLLNESENPSLNI